MVRTSRPTGPAPRRSVGSRLWRVARWFVALGLVATLLGVAAVVVAYRSVEIPDPNADFLTETSFVYYADGKRELGRFATQDRESIPYREMPATIREAVVAAEDQSFWTNQGIDPKGILRAAFSNARGNATQGASTITQQYVKILYLTQERSLERKAKEAILSLKVVRSQSKKEVLEGYLNTIYFGRGAYGIEAASQAYFDVPASALTLRQSAVLASVINNPTQFDPANGRDNRRALRGRYSYVLSNMAAMGEISQSRAEDAARRLPRLPDITASDAYGGQKGHMLTLVRTELSALGFSDSEIDGQGLRVRTTFTPSAMRAARVGVEENRPEGFSDRQLHVAVASVEPGTGALRGFYGGQNYLRSQLNWASAGGMIGSTMKPVTLAAALEAGFSLSDTFEGNSPYEFPDGLQVRNEGSGYDGLGNDYGASVSATTALEESINTAFVDMSQRIPDGPRTIFSTANRLGIPPPERTSRFPGIPNTSRDLSRQDTLITLGRARVSAINMANAYATIAARGKQADVHVIDEVTDASGEVLYAHRTSTQQAIPAPVADDVSYAMQQVVQDGTGAAALALGRPAAGKTGTATNDQDEVSSAWFVGYTPQLSTAVMYVRGDGDDQLDGWLPSYFGADYPTDTWLGVMRRALEGTEVTQFPPPAGVDGDAPDDSDASTPPPAPATTAAEPTTAPPTTGAPPPTTSAPPPPPTTSAPPPTTSAPPPPPTTSAPPTPADDQRAAPGHQRAPVDPAERAAEPLAHPRAPQRHPDGGPGPRPVRAASPVGGS